MHYVRTYHGNSEPEGATVTVGGDELSVDGWAAYELVRRAYRPVRYSGGADVNARDVLESVFCGAVVGGDAVVGGGSTPSRDALARASARLDAALGGLAAIAPTLRLMPGAAHAIVSSTRADVQQASAETDVDQLRAVGLDYALVAACLSGSSMSVVGSGELHIPPLPTTQVDAGNPEAVRELEGACIPHAAAVEQVRANTADRFNRAAVAIETLL